VPNRAEETRPSAGPLQQLLAEHSEEELREALVISENSQLPVISGPSGATVLPYNNTKYESEKRQGLRKANGARKLKKLSNRHLRIISMHLEGKSGETIALAMGCTFITVSRILNDPLAIDLLAVIYKDRQGEIDALAGKAINAVRDGLEPHLDMRTRLGAVDKFTKLKDSIGKEVTTAKSAEDIVAEIFKNHVKIENMQVNIGQDNG